MTPRAAVFSVALLLLARPAAVFSTSLESPLPNGRKTVALQPGKRVDALISGGQADRYLLALSSDQYAHVVIYQLAGDLVVRVIDPDGREIAVMDSDIGAWGPEEVSLRAETPGNYILEIRPLQKEAASGKYWVRMDPLRKATSQDLLRVNAQVLYMEAFQLASKQTAESVRRAIEKYEKAASLWQAAGDEHGQGIAYLAASGLHVRLGEPQQALDAVKREFDAVQRRGDDAEVAIAFNGLGIAYYWLGEIQKSLENFERSLAIRRAKGEANGQGNTLNNIGVVYDSLGEHQKAIGYLRESLSLRQATGDSIGQAATLANLGQAYFGLGENRGALEWLDRALSLSRTVRDQRREATTLDRIGRVYDALGEKEKALDYFNQALSLGRTVGDRSSEAATLTRIGAVYASFGEKQKAIDHYSLALAIGREVGDRAAVGQALLNVARAERDRGNFLKARMHIEAAFEIFDSLRSKVGTHELRASYVASIHDSYEFYVDLLMRLHQREPSEGFEALALKASEGARARGLLELLTESRANVRQGIDSAMVDRERESQRLLDDKTSGQIRLLSAKHSEKEAEEAAAEIESLTTNLQQIRAQIRTSSPRYAALTQPPTLTLEQIRKEVLDRDTLLLEYALGQERSFLWVVGLDGMKTFELPKRGEIETAARRVYDLLSARNRVVKFESAEDRLARVQRADAEYPKAAATLSQMLLGQMTSQLSNKRLLIVADGALQYVPFAALPSPAFPNEFIPLSVEHEIVTLPSASVLSVLRRELAGRSAAPKALAVLADPVFEGSDERVAVERVAVGSGPKKLVKVAGKAAAKAVDSDLVRSAQDVGLVDGGQLRIPRLPFTRKEAKSILSLAASDSRREALDFDANRSAATSAELGQYRIVHFATHGFLNSLHPELSGLVLSLVDRQGKEQDGFLPALEVFNLKLPADLVVLSGCRTGLGKEIKGEGLVGLTRAFMYAGAARVVVSLWDVNDEATAELMSRFYQGMLGEKPLSPAAALRAAQVSVWKEKRWESPYYWAAFVIQGEPK